MDVSRRGFFKISGAALAASGIGIGLTPAEAKAQPFKIKVSFEGPSLGAVSFYALYIGR